MKMNKQHTAFVKFIVLLVGTFLVTIIIDQVISWYIMHHWKICDIVSRESCYVIHYKLVHPMMTISYVILFALIITVPLIIIGWQHSPMLGAITLGLISGTTLTRYIDVFVYGYSINYIHITINHYIGAANLVDGLLFVESMLLVSWIALSRKSIYFRLNSVVKLLYVKK